MQMVHHRSCLVIKQMREKSDHPESHYNDNRNQKRNHLIFSETASEHPYGICEESKKKYPDRTCKHNVKRSLPVGVKKDGEEDIDDPGDDKADESSEEKLAHHDFQISDRRCVQKFHCALCLFFHD